MNAGASEPFDAAAATTGATVLSGSVWKGASLTLPQLYALVQSIVAARFLGPNGMGVQSFIAFCEISLVSLFSTGLSLSLMRYVGELRGRGRAGELRDLVSWGWRFQAIGAVIAGVVLGVAALAGASPRSAWALAAVAAVASILHTVPTAVLIGAQRWRDASIVGLVTGTAATAGIVLVLAAGGGITGMFAVEAAITLANFAWTSALGRRALSSIANAPRVSSTSVRSSARTYALLASVTGVVTFVVWRRSELFFLQHYSTSSEVAFYSIAFAVVAALTALPTTLGDVVSPAVATLFGAGSTERIQRSYARGARLLVFVSLPVTAAALALGPETLRVLWGPDYSQAGVVFLILVAPLPLIPLINYARAFLTGIGLIRVPLMIFVVAAVINVGFDFLFVPPWHAVGAAVANVCAQLAAGIPVLAYTRRQVGHIRWETMPLLRAAVVSALGGSVAWAGVRLLGGLTGLVVGLVAGSVVFLALGALLRILPADDARWLDQSVGGRFFQRWSRQWQEAEPASWSVPPAAGSKRQL